MTYDCSVTYFKGVTPQGRQCFLYLMLVTKQHLSLLFVGCYNDRTLDGILLGFDTNGRSSFSAHIRSHNNFALSVR